MGWKTTSNNPLQNGPQIRWSNPVFGEIFHPTFMGVTFHWWLWAPVNVWWLRPLQKTHRNDLGVGVGCFGDFCCSKIMINNQKTQEVCWIKKTWTSCTLRIIGPSYRGVWVCIAGFRDLQTLSFEIPWFLGYSISFLESVLTDLPGFLSTPQSRIPLRRLWEGGGTPTYSGILWREIISQRHAAMNSCTICLCLGFCLRCAGKLVPSNNDHFGFQSTWSTRDAKASKKTKEHQKISINLNALFSR